MRDDKLEKSVDIPINNEDCIDSVDYRGSNKVYVRHIRNKIRNIEIKEDDIEGYIDLVGINEK